TDPTAGQSNGAIVLTVTGGNPTLTYLWSNNATTKDINNLAAGSYTYTITDGNNCKLTGSVTIGSVALDITNITPVSPPCAGLAGGSINISAVGGTAPYTFAWTGPGGFAATSKDITGLKAGTYKVTVKDAVNATKTSADIILTESGTALTISARVKQPTKAGSDGEISITPAGGTPPISYQWNDGSTSGSRTFLNSGTYSVVARDSKGCSVSQSFNLQPTDGICYTSARVFTPNGDGFNELFVINCAGNISNQLLIYNRWNQLVYSTNNYQNDWNGVDKNGFLLPDGTYYWILKDTSGQSNSLYKGYVTLIRTLN
ncbi:MAG: gliding motility-associated C-terminal domain-containing protein, partial [Saprospiraceae bacterium]|nr:gliding motility-associated C-terminal domain-containing protein [Saprospiraceae bacterium]